MSGAVHAYGTILQLSDGGGTPVYTSIAEIRSIGDMGFERDMIEVTHMESPQKFKEFIAAMIDGLMVTLELNYLPAHATHQDMLTNLRQQTLANIFRNYRVVFPDFGATSYTATVSSGTWTAGSAHGWNTAQPVIFTTTGVLPTMSPAIKEGQIYWARRASSTTFTIFPTSADAIANSNQITGGTGGSGTHSVKGGSVLALRGAFRNAKVSGATNDKLSITTQLKVTGLPVLTP